MLFLGMLYAWSIFVPPLSAQFSTWTSPQMSLTFSISMILFCIGNIISGKLATILSSRWLFLLAGGLLFAGFLGAAGSLSFASPTSTLWGLYLFYGGCCGLGVGIGYNNLVGTLLRWFPDRVGVASGIMLMGFGLGGLVLGSAVTVFIEWVGLSHTFIGLAICISLVLVISALCIRKPRENEVRNLPVQRKQLKASNSRRHAVQFTPSEMLRTSAFWIFFLWLICVSSGGLIVINSAVPLAKSFGLFAGMGLVVSLFNGGGRIVHGAIFDKFGSPFAFICNSCMLLTAGIILFLAVKWDSSLLLLIGLPLIGLSFAGAPAITSAAVNVFWGARNFPANFGITNCNLIPAALLGPMVSSALLGQSGGDYSTTFMLIMGLGVIAIILSFLLIMQVKKIR